jgi:hypothetical protein
LGKICTGYKELAGALVVHCATLFAWPVTNMAESPAPTEKLGKMIETLQV